MLKFTKVLFLFFFYVVFSGFFTTAHWAWWIFSFAYFSGWSALICRSIFLLRLTFLLIILLLYDAFRNRFFYLGFWAWILIWRYALSWFIFFLFVVWYNIIFRYGCRSVYFINLWSKLAYFILFFEIFFSVRFIIWSLNEIV